MVRVVVSTFPTREAAAVATRTLVAESLAACGSILAGVRSIYQWKGRIEDNDEVMVIFKTASTTYCEFERRLRQLHPYEVPEIVAFDPAAVLEPYAEWALGCCREIQ